MDLSKFKMTRRDLQVPKDFKEFKSTLDEAIFKASEDLESKKVKLIESRILDRFGVEIDLKKEVLKTFPRIAAVKHDNGTEVFYYNDGSEEGCEIIRFMGTHMSQNDLERGLGFTYKINYI